MGMTSPVGPKSIIVLKPQVRLVPVKCINCGHEDFIPHEMQCDSDMTCSACGEQSEFRQFREAWCAARRDALTHACPEIHFPSDRLTREYR
jgi:ribosomal protein S27E